MVVALTLILAARAPARAQGTAPSAVAQATRSREAGDLATATALLREHLATNPADSVARRLLAETLYWQRDVRGARAEYERALELHPGDHAARLQYGRLLVETGAGARAREILDPLRSGSADATALLGTLAYWEGDYTGARRLFREALSQDSTHADARRQLREIAIAASPWLGWGGELRTDDQPLDVAGALVEAGWYATPLLALSARARPARHAPDGAPSFTSTGFELAMSHYLPALRLESEAGAGAILRSRGGSTHIARAMLGLRLPGRAIVRVRAARAPYLWTVSSLEAPFTTSNTVASLAWSHPRGWLGEAAIGEERFPDDNAVRTAYAWLLAPLVQGPRGLLQAGWSSTAQDSRESRFVRVTSPGPGQGGPPVGQDPGRYAPYFTPERLQVQSVLVAATLHPSPRVELRAGGDYGVQANDDAPVLPSGPGNVPGTDGPYFWRRSFHPWTARGALSVAVSDQVRLSASVEHGRTVFYEWTSAGVQVTWRFTDRALRREP